METRDITLPIAEVTVLEDRALVVRRGRVVLSAGANRLRLAGLSPLAVDKTVVADGGARVADVRLRRERIPRAERQAALAAIETRRRAIVEQLTDLERQEFSLDSVATQVRAQRCLLLADAVVDTAWSRPEPAAWDETLHQLEAREDADLQRRAALTATRRSLSREVEDLDARAALLADPGSKVACSATLLVEASSDGEAELRLTYVVPNACWRPCHAATLSRSRDQVRFAAEACVWQRTGEDWRGVTLRLSTERLDLGCEPPRLQPDLLRLQPKAAQVVIAERDREVEETGGAAGAAELPGVDDGGEVRLLTASGAHDLPSDGLPQRFPLFAFTVPARCRLVLRGELAPAAILASEQANAANQPLLAGPVELLRDGGHAGRATMRFTAPGATFELGWGPEPELQIERRASRSDEEPGVLGSWRTARHRVAIGISNLGATAHQLTDEERIPVSELAQVQVEADATATVPAAQPDANGIVRWPIAVAPRGRAEVVLAYAVRRQAATVQAS